MYCEYETAISEVAVLDTVSWTAVVWPCALVEVLVIVLWMMTVVGAAVALTATVDDSTITEP